MQCVNAMWCMTLHGWNVSALGSLLWSFFIKFCHILVHAPFASMLVQSPFSFALRRYFSSRCLPITLHLLFYSWGQKTILVQSFSWEAHGFSFLCPRLHNSRVVNKFLMNNEKSLMQCNYSNHTTKQNAQCICKGTGIAKDSNELLRPNDNSFIDSK